MSILVIQIPPRDRLQAGPDAPPDRSPGEFDYVLSPDGLAVGSRGRCAPALLPKSGSVVVVLADTDVSWHRVTLPKAPAARLRAALAGVLEEALLEDPDELHFAIAPGAVAGQPTWVATTHRARLLSQLATLEAAGRAVERVLPSAWPDEAALGHFTDRGDLPEAPPQLTWSDADGVVTLAADGGLARQLLPAWRERAARWSATPAAAAAAEAWLGAPVEVLAADERTLQAVRSRWNLRQFDLAPRHRGTQALREGWRRFLSPGFRPVRWGAGALVLVQLVGLNAWAWHERREIGQRRDAMVALLQKAHPQVRAVLDAPVQMSRETDLLRVAAGQPGDTDLETLLNAAAAAWPPGAGPATTLRFEPGRLLFTAPEWGPEQTDLFRSQLRATGWSAEEADGGLAVSRGAGGRS